MMFQVPLVHLAVGAETKNQNRDGKIKIKREEEDGRKRVRRV